MKNIVWLALLALAATLEAGGDALARTGLHAHGGLTRLGAFAAAALVLFAYGLTVNAPPWDFGRLLGVYVALFFLAAQLTNYVAFGVAPSPPVLAGGALIISGGLLMTFWTARGF